MKSFITKLSVMFLPALFLLANTTNAVIDNPIKANNIQELITAFLGIMIDIAVIISVLAFIFAGLKMVLARGNPEGIKEAKNMLLYTAIGACISVGAKSIQLVIQNTVKQLQ